MLKNKQIAINIYRDEHPYDTFSIVTIHSNTYAKYDENVYREYIYIGHVIKHIPIYIDDINAYRKDYHKLNYHL